MDRKQVARFGMKVAKRSVTERLYLQTGVDVTTPSAIKGMINERCNSRCRYCAYWRMEEFSENGYLDEMSIDDWKRALLSLKELCGNYTIQFSGGEPFIKKGFVDLLEFLHSHDIGWGVITNAIVLKNKKVVERTVKAHPFNLDISVDSPDPEIHNYTRGVPKGLQRTEKAIKLLREARETFGIHFPIRIKATVTRNSFRSLPHFVDWLDQVGGDTLDFSPVRPWTKESKTEMWIDSEEERQELQRVCEILRDQKRRGAPIETADEKLASFPAHFLKNPIRHGASPCRVGLREYQIRCDGQVEVCWFFEPLGNVKHQSAREIWYGDVAQRIRAETVACTRFGSVDCANSCLTARSIKQEIKRGLTVLKSQGLQALRSSKRLNSGREPKRLETVQRSFV